MKFDNIQSDTDMLAAMCEKIYCSVILITGADKERFYNYIELLSRLGLPQQYEIVIIDSGCFAFDKVKVNNILRKVTFIDSYENCEEKHLMDKGIAGSRGEYLLIIRDFVPFSSDVLNQAIEELKSCNQKISISENQKFILAERLYLKDRGGFKGLFAPSTSNSPVEDSTKNVLFANNTVAEYKSKPNIIVIISDALRADHLSCYGYHRPTCPNIDEFARQTVLFESAFSASPTTSSSIPSIMSGLLPSIHRMGVEGNRLYLNEKIKTLPQMLKEMGYTTVGFNTNPLVAGMYGYDRGFCERYEVFPQCGSKLQAELSFDESGKAGKYSLDFAQHTVCSKDVNQQVFNWLKYCRKEPFFMWIHYMDTHSRYNPRQPYFSNYSSGSHREDIFKFLRHYDSIFSRLHQNCQMEDYEKKLIVDCYDSEINYFDNNFGTLVSLLKRECLLDGSLMFLTADHGEEFWEHDLWGHSMRMYDYNLHVPLILSYPRCGTGRVKKQVRNIDIFPTVLDCLGLESHDLSGTSLLPYLNNKTSALELPVISEGGGLKRLTKDEFVDRVFAIRTSRWKLIENATKAEFELYNLKEDPFEKENLAKHSETQHVINELSEQLKSAIKRNSKSSSSVCAPIMSEQISARLAALGYD